MLQVVRRCGVATICRRTVYSILRAIAPKQKYGNTDFRRYFVTRNARWVYARKSSPKLGLKRKLLLGFSHMLRFFEDHCNVAWCDVGGANLFNESESGLGVLPCSDTSTPCQLNKEMASASWASRPSYDLHCVSRHFFKKEKLNLVGCP